MNWSQTAFKKYPAKADKAAITIPSVVICIYASPLSLSLCLKKATISLFTYDQS